MRKFSFSKCLHYYDFIKGRLKCIKCGCLPPRAKTVKRNGFFK